MNPITLNNQRELPQIKPKQNSRNNHRSRILKNEDHECSNMQTDNKLSMGSNTNNNNKDDLGDYSKLKLN